MERMVITKKDIQRIKAAAEARAQEEAPAALEELAPAGPGLEIMAEEEPPKAMPPAAAPVAIPAPAAAPAGVAGVASEEIKPDSYWDRLIKYIPAEVIALYLSLTTIIQSFSDKVSIQAWIPWAAFLVGVLATIVYLTKILKVTKTSQILISLGAFLVWAFALGGPFKGLFDNQSLVAGLLVPIYTFFIPAWEA